MVSKIVIVHFFLSHPNIPKAFDIMIIWIKKLLKDVEELVKEESVLKIVTDYISTEKEADLEGVEEVKRKGEEVLLEMCRERERFKKVIKKEEIKGEEVKMEILEKEIETPLNLDQEISKVSWNLINHSFIE